MTAIAINKPLIEARLIQLGASEREFYAAFDLYPLDMLEDVPLEHLSVIHLGRLAEALGLHPADLLVSDPPEIAHARADGLLAQFALAGAEREERACAEFLGWDRSRFAAARAVLQPCGAWMRVPENLAPQPEQTAAQAALAAARYRSHFALCTAPDPFDAAALLRLLHAHATGSPASTSGPEASRLAELHLALPVEASGTRTPFADSGLDTAIAPHPDLLYALDLAGPPDPLVEPSPRDAWADAFER